MNYWSAKLRHSLPQRATARRQRRFKKPRAEPWSAIDPKRGEIYLANLDKPRPAIILSVDQLNRHALDVCVVPITTKQHARFVLRVPLKRGEGGLDSDCWAKCDQVTTLEKRSLRPRPLGALSAAKLQEIEQQVKFALGLL